MPLATFVALAMSAQEVTPPALPRPAVPARLITPHVFRDEDYPTEAARYRVRGVVRYFIVINVAGRVSHCRVTRSSGWALLDETTCRLLRERARYEPARDAGGNPTVDTDVGELDFRVLESTTDRVI
jgi:protein TonB